MAAEITKQTIFIDGMTCVSCENRIRNKLAAAKGVIEAKVSYAAGTAQVSYDENRLTKEEINRIIEKAGYHVITERKREKRPFTFWIGIGIILYAVYIIFRRYNLFSVFQSFPIVSEQVKYVMLPVIGLLTSVHCVAMCGGICLSQSLKAGQGIKERDSTQRIRIAATIRPSLLYNLGRVISYTVIGGIVGGLGAVVQLTGMWRGAVQIAAGIFMIIMGLSLLNSFHWLRRFVPRMPRLIPKKMKPRKNSPLYVGLLNGLMPCGPLQAMQLYALSSGSILKGAMAMFLFSIGTVPLMLGFGAIGSLLSKKFTSGIMKAGAVLVVILGVFMMNQGVTLSGGRVLSGAVYETEGEKINKALIRDGVQIVSSEVHRGAYERIVVQKGIPVQWTLKVGEKMLNGCNYSIVIPKLDMTYQFKQGDNLIEFTPEESGTITYSCWMGMIRSQIIVVDDLKGELK